MINLNDGTHSRFDEEHYKNCEPCYDAHWDFMQELRDDERHNLKYESEE